MIVSLFLFLSLSHMHSILLSSYFHHGLLNEKLTPLFLPFIPFLTHQLSVGRRSSLNSRNSHSPVISTYNQSDSSGVKSPLPPPHLFSFVWRPWSCDLEIGSWKYDLEICSWSYDLEIDSWSCDLEICPWSCDL